MFAKLFELLGMSSLNTALNVAATRRAHIFTRFPLLKTIKKILKKSVFFSSSYHNEPCRAVFSELILRFLIPRSSKSLAKVIFVKRYCVQTFNSIMS